MIDRVRLFVPIVLAAGLALSACSSGGSSSSGSNEGEVPPAGTQPADVVALQFTSFAPGQVTVHVGQYVEWDWKDSPVQHNVTFSDKASPTRADGKWFKHFTQPGTYTYSCTVHANMTGTVTVVP